MEIRLKIGEEYARELMTKLDIKSATEMTQEALAVLNWAAEEAAKGRIVLSADPEGNDVHRLVTPALGRAQTRGGAR